LAENEITDLNKGCLRVTYNSYTKKFFNQGYTGDFLKHFRYLRVPYHNYQ